MPGNPRPLLHPGKKTRAINLAAAKSQLAAIRREVTVVVNTEYHWTMCDQFPSSLPCQYYPTTKKFVTHAGTTHKNITPYRCAKIVLYKFLSHINLYSQA